MRKFYWVKEPGVNEHFTSTFTYFSLLVKFLVKYAKKLQGELSLKLHYNDVCNAPHDSWPNV